MATHHCHKEKQLFFHTEFLILYSNGFKDGILIFFSHSRQEVDLMSDSDAED